MVHSVRGVVVCRKQTTAVRDGRGGTGSLFANKNEVPPPRLSVMDGVCLNDNSRNLGGGGSTPTPRAVAYQDVLGW